MTDATYTLHQALIRLAKGMLAAWEKWLIVSSGSIELGADLAARRMPARQTAATTTQSSTRRDDRRERTAVER